MRVFLRPPPAFRVVLLLCSATTCYTPTASGLTSNPGRRPPIAYCDQDVLHALRTKNTVSLDPPPVASRAFSDRCGAASLPSTHKLLQRLTRPSWEAKDSILPHSVFDKCIASRPQSNVGRIMASKRATRVFIELRRLFTCPRMCDHFNHAALHLAGRAPRRCLSSVI